MSSPIMSQYNSEKCFQKSLYTYIYSISVLTNHTADKVFEHTAFLTLLQQYCRPSFNLRNTQNKGHKCWSLSPVKVAIISLNAIICLLYAY